MVQRLKNDGTVENVYPPQTATPDKAAYIDLPPGKAMGLSSSSDAFGYVQQMDIRSGAVMRVLQLTEKSVGPFATTQRFCVVVSSGSVTASVGDVLVPIAAAPVLNLSRVLTRGPLNNTPVRASGGPNNTVGATSTNTCSIKMELEGEFDQVRLVLGGFEINGVPITGIKAVIAATETAATDTADKAFRPIAGGVKYNALRSSTDNFGWDAVTWKNTSVWDGAAPAPVVADLASAATGSLPLAQIDTLTTQRPVDGPSGLTLPSFMVSDWMPTASIPRADGGVRPLLLVRFYMPGDATHKWSYMSVPAGGTYQADAAQRAAFRDRVYQCAYSFSDNVANLNDNFSSSIASIIPYFYVQYKSRSGGITTMSVGDSISECTYMADTVSSWGHRAACDVSTPELPVQYINCGWSGKGTMQYWKQARNIMTVIRPDVIMYSPYSQNDAVYTRRASQNQLARAADMVDYCTQNGIVPICWTGTPVETGSLAADTERRYVNAQTLKMLPGPLSSSQMLDVSALVSRGLAPPATDLFKPDVGQNSYKYNTGHPSEWAMEVALSPANATALRRIIGKVV